jgi:hypothetical protein
VKNFNSKKISKDKTMSDNQDPATNQNKKKESKRSPPYALFNLLVIIVAIIYAAYYHIYLKDAETLPSGARENDELTDIPMFTAEQLKSFNGEGECQTIFLSSCALFYFILFFWKIKEENRK